MEEIRHVWFSFRADSVGKQLQFSDGQNDSGESGEEEGEGEEERGGAKPAVDVKPSAAVPLGWPKVRVKGK